MNSDNNNNNANLQTNFQTNNKRKISFTVGAVASAIAIITTLGIIKSSLVSIKPGYVGVVYSMDGGIKNATLPQGYHFIAPIDKVTSYPVSTETVFLSQSQSEGSKIDESFDINSKSGKPVNVDISYSYHMDANKLPEIFTKFRGQDAQVIEDNFIRAKLKSAINNCSSQYEVMDIYGSSRPELRQKVFDVFSKDMAQYGIIIESFDFTGIRPDKASMQSIQDKVNAEQAAQTALILQQKAKTEAETAKITAQGQADANTVLQASVTDQLIKYKELEVAGKQADAMAKWNVSTYVAGSSTPLINVPTNH